MSVVRQQLTLFIEPPAGGMIEQVRRRFNPQQHALIAAHITLCREDELESLTSVAAKLANRFKDGLKVTLGKAKRFADGKGLMLPPGGNNEEFYALREWLLPDRIETRRSQEPHITLMHPRNSTCTDKIFEEIQFIQFPTDFFFTQVALIEQEAGCAWKLLQVFEL